MRCVLFMFMFAGLVNCDKMLNNMIDAKLKQLANQPRTGTDSLSGSVYEDGYEYHFNFVLSGIKRRASRITDVTVTAGDSGHVVGWKQKEPVVGYTGRVDIKWDLGTGGGYDVSGDISLKPVSVELRQKHGRFQVITDHAKVSGVQTWTLKSRHMFVYSQFHEELTPGVNGALASQLRNSPFWACVHEGQDWALEWPELAEYLEQAYS
ncbi:hypothetical protein HDE_09804 [Halotydeus destructor]|nr:hypothetical protein HDE_09804 [Halotydeus destructor]